MKRVLVEAVWVILAGFFFALGANYLSPRGLALGQNYFLDQVRPPPLPSSSKLVTAAGANPNTLTSADSVAARLKEKGLQVADSNQVAQFFRDPRYEQELYIFVDARDDQHGYQEGHVPGAYQFDHYHPADYLLPVRSACETAEKIVVYCNGGNCDDSEFAALDLQGAGVPQAKLFVYAGGFAEWASNGLPVEVGARKSGQLKEPKK